MVTTDPMIPFANRSAKLQVVCPVESTTRTVAHPLDAVPDTGAPPAANASSSLDAHPHPVQDDFGLDLKSVRITFHKYTCLLPR